MEHKSPEVKPCTYRQTTVWSENGQKTWVDIFIKKTHRWPTGVWKDVQHCWLLEKCNSRCLEWLILKKSTNDKCWIRCGEKEILVPQKTISRTTVWSSNSTPGDISRQKKMKTLTCTLVFIPVVFTIAKTWKQAQVPSTDKWLKV